MADDYKSTLNSTERRRLHLEEISKQVFDEVERKRQETAAKTIRLRALREAAQRS